MDSKLIELVKDKEVTGLVWRCLVFLIAKMDWDNVVKIPQSDIVKELGASPQKVSAALRTLSEKSYITIDASRRPQVYKVSHLLAQRGTKRVKADA